MFFRIREDSFQFFSNHKTIFDVFIVRFVIFHKHFHFIYGYKLCCSYILLCLIAEVLTTFIHPNIIITYFLFHFRHAQNNFLAFIAIHVRSLFMFVARTHYVDAFKFLTIHQSNSGLNVFVDVSNYFADAFCSIGIQFNCFVT